jgi:2',3'-cyclic-nucleotide 2'-phosphodiesterase (5'-nucleotidase family)
MRTPAPAAFLAQLGLALSLAVPAAAGAEATAKHPEQLVILSTTDVKGKTGPCGCHVPKGGLSRQASFADSMRSQHANVMWVDNGGYFPEDSAHIAYAGFLMDEMKRLGLDAVGLSERDLHFGVSYLKAQVQRSGLPVVCANLVERSTQKAPFPPYVLKKIGSVTVGILGLLGNDVDLGPSRDSLAASEPLAAAQGAIAEMRRKGATVVVLLSQVGKVQTEDLVAAVEGIDVAIVGRNSPVLPKGRVLGSTVVSYAGEQGQYFGKTTLTLDAKGNATQRESETLMLSPEVGERPEVQARVKQFEDRFNERARKANADHVDKSSLLVPETTPGH